MVKSIVRQNGWSPEIISSLYLDGVDYFGLEYWYEDVKEVNESITKKQ